MFETIKKGLLTGLGIVLITKERLDKKVEKLVQEGKLSQAEAEQMLNDLLKSGEDYWDAVEVRIKDNVQQSLENLDLCTKKDLLKLQEEIKRLQERVTELETPSAE
ncbi:MAG: phasin family protein [Desulfurivibrionaceae bacterium]